MSAPLAGWLDRFRHAFALPGTDEPPTPGQLVAAERFCRAVVQRGWEMPVIAALETAAPLHNVAAQSLAFAQPLIEPLFDPQTLLDWRGFLERSDAAHRLTECLATLVSDRSVKKTAE